MHKITKDIVGAFNRGEARKRDNTESTGRTLFYQGYKIAEKVGGKGPDHGLWVRSGGYEAALNERLNAIDGVRVTKRGGKLYLNGTIWNGDWTNVKKHGGMIYDLSSMPTSRYDKTKLWD